MKEKSLNEPFELKKRTECNGLCPRCCNQDEKVLRLKEELYELEPAFQPPSMSVMTELINKIFGEKLIEGGAE